MARGRGNQYKPRAKQRLKKIATGLAPRIPRGGGADSSGGAVAPPNLAPRPPGAPRRPLPPKGAPPYAGRKPKKAPRRKY